MNPAMETKHALPEPPCQKGPGVAYLEECVCGTEDEGKTWAPSPISSVSEPILSKHAFYFG